MTTKLEKIMDLLANKEMTSVELAPLLKISVANCSYKLNVLYNDGRIERVSNNMPFKYKLSLTPIELLKFLNDFFKANIDYLMANNKIDLFIEQNEKIFDKIEELVK